LTTLESLSIITNVEPTVPASPPSSPLLPNTSPRATNSRFPVNVPTSLLALTSTVLPTESTADDSHKLVKVIASHGKTGDQIELAYSHSKVVGNGSFGVVFSAKLAPGSLGPDNEGDDDVAIKKVLQDKRFKVSLSKRHHLRNISSFRSADTVLLSSRLCRTENFRS
jgi:glycogen synthase kinase 3 beta